MISATLHIAPMLFQCWPAVNDGGPTLNQPWVSVSCLLGTHYHSFHQCGGVRGTSVTDNAVHRHDKQQASVWIADLAEVK